MIVIYRLDFVAMLFLKSNRMYTEVKSRHHMSDTDGPNVSVNRFCSAINNEFGLAIKRDWKSSIPGHEPINRRICSNTQITGRETVCAIIAIIEDTGNVSICTFRSFSFGILANFFKSRVLRRASIPVSIYCLSS